MCLVVCVCAGFPVRDCERKERNSECASRESEFMCVCACACVSGHVNIVHYSWQEPTLLQR